MGYTPIKKKQVALSERGHFLACQEIYPLLFNTPREELDIAYLFGSKKDMDYGIDVEIKVKHPDDRAPLCYGFQERFRKYDKQAIEKFRDVTFTTWNRRSNTPGEWYKFRAVFMVYGFLNGDENTSTGFFNWGVVNIPALQLCYSQRIISPASNNVNDRNQDFVGFSYQDLYNAGCLTRFSNLGINPFDFPDLGSDKYDLSQLNDIIDILNKQVIQAAFDIQFEAARKGEGIGGLVGGRAGQIVQQSYDIRDMLMRLKNS